MSRPKAHNKPVGELIGARQRRIKAERRTAQAYGEQRARAAREAAPGIEEMVRRAAEGTPSAEEGEQENT